MRYMILGLISLFVLNISWGEFKINSNNTQSSYKGTKSNDSVDTINTSYKDFVKPDSDELKNKLTPLQYNVTQKEDTERAFTNTYWDNKKEGIYVDVVSGEPLFSSKDKYDSKSGWPSFTQPLEASLIIEKEDNGFFSKRTEVKSKYADSHLGHVFTDGPQPSGLRYCINSASLRFVSKEKLTDSGYSKYSKLFE